MDSHLLFLGVQRVQNKALFFIFFPLISDVMKLSMNGLQVYSGFGVHIPLFLAVFLPWINALDHIIYTKL